MEGKGRREQEGNRGPRHTGEGATQGQGEERPRGQGKDQRDNARPPAALSRPPSEPDELKTHDGQNNVDGMAAGEKCRNHAKGPLRRTISAFSTEAIVTQIR